MNSMQVIERLVSLRNNACNRAIEESRKNTECNIYEMRVSLLENGINQLIIEMQNNIIAEYRIKKTETAYGCQDCEHTGAGKSS
ncbi:MAG: hypothetical protein ABFD04_11120 [Syntrophomonas sp.]